MIVKIYIDACCHIQDAHVKGRMGVGNCACGVIIIDENNEEYTFSRYLGEKTVPQAEFEGLVFGLDKAVEVVKRTANIMVWMDSKLVIGWMNKNFKLTKEHIKPLFDKANLYSQRFKSV